jgi:uncharacterized RDD family membrane protein YckC
VTYEDRISIPTPEGVELELVLAGVGSRLVGEIVDGLLKGVILFALWIVSGAVASDGGGFFVALLIIASFLVFWGYDVAFETLASGRTPGKRAAGLRVVRLGGEPVGFLASAVRNLLRVVDMQPGFLYAVGALSILFSQRNQRLGDLAAGTLVVRERRAPLPAAARPPVPDFATADRYAAWDVSGVTAFELVTVRRFLERRWQLDPGARNRLGWELAERLRPKVVGAPPNLHPEQFLEALAEAKASRG